MGYYVGHGRHWQFFSAAGVSNDEVMRLITDVYLSSLTKVVFEIDDLRFLCEPSVELGFGLLVRGHSIRSAFPYATGGNDWPLDIREIYEWPDPIEGQLLGSCRGARVGWFDPHFAENRHCYVPQSGTYMFRMNALAYRIGRTQFASAEHEQMMGQMKAYLPLSSDDASEDELQFSSQVEAVRSLHFHGVSSHVYAVTLALPDDFPMRVNVCTPRSAADEVFAVGDRISGSCWLIGRLIR